MTLILLGIGTGTALFFGKSYHNRAAAYPDKWDERAVICLLRACFCHGITVGLMTAFLLMVVTS